MLNKWLSFELNGFTCLFLLSRCLCPWRFYFFSNIFRCEWCGWIKINEKWKHKWPTSKPAIYFINAFCIVYVANQPNRWHIRGNLDCDLFRNERKQNPLTEVLNILQKWSKKTEAIFTLLTISVNEYYEPQPPLIDAIETESTPIYGVCDIWIASAHR